jgi:hypothetical protein
MREAGGERPYRGMGNKTKRRREMLYQIKSWRNGNVIQEIEADSQKKAIELLVKTGANLREANLSGANLSGANLSGLKLSKEITIQSTNEAISIADDLFWAWKTFGIRKTQQMFQAYLIPNENRALVIFSPTFEGGWCYILERNQIWWWSWSCPNPNTVPIIWDGNK